MIFSFLGAEFVNGVTKYECFQFWVILLSGRWLWRDATFLSFFQSFVIAKQPGEYATKTNCFLTISLIVISDFLRVQMKNDAKIMISGGEL